jgi:hypothetical protein
LVALGAAVASTGGMAFCEPRMGDSTAMTTMGRNASKRGQEIMVRVTRFETLKANGKKEDALEWSPNREVAEEVVKEPTPDCPMCRYCKSGTCGEKFSAFNDAVQACTERGVCDSDKLNANLLDFIVCMERDPEYYDEGIFGYFLEMFDTFNPPFEEETY